MPKTLISSEQIKTGLTQAVAYRITYHSQDLQGKPTVSSGLVVTPSGSGQNRKVLSWAHGTTGIGDAACPSAQPDPARELVTYFQSKSPTQIDYGIPGLQKFIDEDWIVVATDYQGLGTEGMHQYSINLTNARDALNIVHALHEMNVGAGKKFGAIGWSQGGGATAGMLELDTDLFGDLELVGAVHMSPGVPSMALRVPGLGDAIKAGEIPNDPHVIMLLAALTAAFPETLSMDDLFTPFGKQLFEDNWNIQTVHHLGDIFQRNAKLSGPTMSIKADKQPDVVNAFLAASAGVKKPMAPGLVLTDGIDGPCPIPWQNAYIDAVKAFGGEISQTIYPKDDHFSLPQASIDEARSWLLSKF